MHERPIYLDLTKIRLPISALISITHRLSGMYIFFIAMPLFLYVIDKSISSKASFDQLVVNLSSVSYPYTIRSQALNYGFFTYW